MTNRYLATDIIKGVIHDVPKIKDADYFEGRLKASEIFKNVLNMGMQKYYDVVQVCLIEEDKLSELLKLKVEADSPKLMSRVKITRGDYAGYQGRLWWIKYQDGGEVKPYHNAEIKLDTTPDGDGIKKSITIHVKLSEVIKVK